MKKKDQSFFPTEHVVTPIVGEDGVQSGFVSVVRDITSRKDSEKALRERDELYRLTIESTDDGIAVVALDGHVLEANSRFIQMWAVPEPVLQKGGNELISHMTNRLVAVEGLTSEGWSPLLPEDLGPSRDIFHLKDGRILEVYQAPVVRDGTAIAQLWMFHDITQLERARQSAGLYLDLMCHDIRNRLQVITMNVDLMGMLFAGLDVSSYLSQIQSDVTRCAELIGKAKQTERLEEVPLRLISLSQAVRESTALVLGHYSDVAVELFLGNSEAFIEANEYLTVLLAQLMQNAVIHNPREAKAIWIRLDEHHEDYELSVADNGSGIPDSRKQSLFDSSRRYGGIGLHLAHHIMDRYGGRIAVRDRVEGDPSQGADFWVSFPKPHRHQVDLANRMPGEGIVDSSGTVSKTGDSQSTIT